MKLNIFYGYSDCNPKDSSVEEIFQIIRQDARVKNRTEKHRYYLEHNLEKEALIEKSSNPCFSVATLFANGKTQKHIIGWPGIGMVDIDHRALNLEPLIKMANQDPHTLLSYTTISGQGLRILFQYDCKNRDQLNNAEQKMQIGRAHV